MHLHRAIGHIYFSCLVLEFIFASCNKRPFHFNIIKFELPGFQSDRVPFLFVPYFVLRFCTGTETSVGGMHLTKMRHKTDTTNTQKRRARGPTSGAAEPMGRPAPGEAHSTPPSYRSLVCVPKTLNLPAFV